MPNLRLITSPDDGDDSDIDLDEEQYCINNVAVEIHTEEGVVKQEREEAAESSSSQQKRSQVCNLCLYRVIHLP